MGNVNPLRKFAARCSRGFVLAFHEIAPERLTALTECLHPARVIPLTELVQRSKAGRSTSGLFAITVDDGIGEQVRSLARLFVNNSWPATFYLPTHYLDTGQGMAFQRWRSVQPLLPRRRLTLRSGVLDLSVPHAVKHLAKRMERLWHSERMESYLNLTQELEEVIQSEDGVSLAALRPAPPISWREVEELSKNDLLQFESHGVSHAAMSTLTEEELEFEMRHSRDRVQEHTGRPCRHLAYPFGNVRSVGSLAARVARRFYDSACTMTLGHVDAADPWLLPRIPLYAKNSTFLVRMKIILKCTGSVGSPASQSEGRPAGAGARGESGYGV